MNIILEKLEHADLERLYEFELKNRTYFEKMVPSRGHDYYEYKIFKEKNELLIEEQAQEISYFYLIKNDNGQIIGRINLVDIDKSQQLGHVGYRVGEEYVGKGLANKALKLLLAMVSNQGIKHIAAKTTTNNITSQKILEKNGFKYIGTSDDKFDMNGQSEKFVYYRWSDSEANFE